FRVAARARREQERVQSVSVQGSLDGVAVAIALSQQLRLAPSVSSFRFAPENKNAHGRSPWPNDAVRTPKRTECNSDPHAFVRSAYFRECRSPESVLRSSAA